MESYIDMHCDTLMRAYLDKREIIFKAPEYMLDISRLREGGCLAQFFAIFMLQESKRKILGDAFPEDMEYIRALLQIFHKSLQESADLIAPAKTVRELEQNALNGKMSGILSLEDGRAVEGKFENIEWLYEEGIRIIALTWNYENCFGYPNSADRESMQKGLKAFGKEAVEVMNEMGMIIDVSHLSDGGFWDVARLSKVPFIATHSNCRALSPHPRNLTDEMIRALAEKGGVMGLNFCPEFLNGDASGKESRIPLMIQHLKHMVNVGGIETPAIGTDLDGITGHLEIGSCSQVPRLFEAMEKSGFTAGQIDMIAHKNVERVLRECLK